MERDLEITSISNQEIGPGEISFLYEDWTGQGFLSQDLCHLPSKLKLNEVVNVDFKIASISVEQPEALKA